MKNTQAFLFDMDGVIIDSEPLHTLARAKFFAELGIPADTEKRIVLGAHKSEYWKVFKEEFALKPTLEELLEREFDFIVETVKERKTPESKNLTKLLRFLTDNGIKCAVGSSSPGKYVKSVLEYLNIDKYYSTIVCGDEVKAPKPAPDTYLIAAEKLGADKDKCFVVEDSRTGSLAALNAGITCIGYRGTESAAHKTDFSACKYVVSDMSEIIDIVKAAETDPHTV